MTLKQGTSHLCVVATPCWIGWVLLRRPQTRAHGRIVVDHSLVILSIAKCNSHKTRRMHVQLTPRRPCILPALDSKTLCWRGMRAAPPEFTGSIGVGPRMNLGLHWRADSAFPTTLPSNARPKWLWQTIDYQALNSTVLVHSGQLIQSKCGMAACLRLLCSCS
jgi:hypothetical protein